MQLRNNLSIQKTAAQGTIEYLVILAIVIVIGLVVIGLLVSMADSGSITEKNDKLKNMIGTGGISILEATIDEDGTALITLKGTGTDILTIESITVEGGNENLYTTQINDKNNTFLIKHLGTLCKCEPGQTKTTCTFNIKTHLPGKLTHTTQIKITADCATDTNTITPPIQPAINLCLDYQNLGEYDGNKIVCTCTNLQNIDQNLSASYLLVQDIDCSQSLTWDSGTGFEPIGDATGSTYVDNFTGTLFGNNKTITNLHINRPDKDYVGLFEKIPTGGIVKNLSLTDANITGRNRVGSIVGHISTGSTSLENLSCIDCDINGTSSVGGIVGQGSNRPGITKVMFKGTVNGTSYIGGIIGFVENNVVISLSNSYVTESTITGSTNIGGILGGTYGRGSLSNTYFSGTSDGYSIAGYNYSMAYTTYSNNFFDSTISGPINSCIDNSCGESKTTSEMKQESTFVNWDFTNTWSIDADQTYPYLQTTN
ncbi:MAG: hypothetical protein WC915_06130 [archaeon]|jgi:hypothetical protein